MRFVFVTLAILLFQQNFAYAGAECQKYQALEKKYKVSLEGLQCGKEIKNKKRFVIKGFKLIAASEYDDYSSIAFYDGDKIIEGLVYYPDGPNDNYAFDSEYGYFSFGGGMEAKDLASIKYPFKYEHFEGEGQHVVLHERECKTGELKAKAKFRIKFFQDTKAESCQEGTWLYDYQIISVGKYSCMK